MRTFRSLFSLMIPLLIFSANVRAKGPPDRDLGPRQESEYRLRASVFSTAGAPGASEHYRTNGSLGQSTPPGVGEDPNGILYAGFWKGFALSAWAVGVEEETPAVSSLSQNYPNPFNPKTLIRYSLSTESSVVIEIFNIKGERVRVLLDGPRPAGPHAVVWNGLNDSGDRLASGIYFYRLRAGSFTDIKKMVMIK